MPMPRRVIGRRAPVRRTKKPPAERKPSPVSHASNAGGHGLSHAIREKLGEIFPIAFGRGERGPTPVEKIYFPRQRTVSKAIERELNNLKLSKKHTLEQIEQFKYRHFKENPELLKLRLEILELIKNGRIKSPLELNAAVEQLIQQKVESGALDQMKGMQMQVNIKNNIEKFRLFTIEEKAKLKKLFGKYHRGANISRIDVPPGEIGSNAGQARKKAA